LPVAIAVSGMSLRSLMGTVLPSPATSEPSAAAGWSDQGVP
jgi:hypothetical protein